MKIAVIGTGRVGSTTAFCLANDKRIDELILINRTKYKAEGLKMDLMGAFPHRGGAIRVGDFSDANDADIILIACGAFGAPKGQNLYDVNKPIIEDLFKKLKLKKKSKVIITTTPVDKLALTVLRSSGLDENSVIGFGGQLDVNRLKYLIFRDKKDFSRNIEAHYIGEHGARGIPIFTEKVLDRKQVIEETRNYFRLYLSKINASTYGTAAELAKLVNALMNEAYIILDISYYNKEKRIFITWPCAINRKGVREPIDLNLSDKDRICLEELIKKRVAEEL